MLPCHVTEYRALIGCVVPRFVPPQRWLHNIEHGAVVALYHPCTHPHTVASLRSLVTGCIRKHVITPSTNLPEDRPLALVAWGCRLLMSKVEPEKVKQFIRTRGLKGPEVSCCNQCDHWPM